jgi:hypothetical protein
LIDRKVIDGFVHVPGQSMPGIVMPTTRNGATRVSTPIHPLFDPANLTDQEAARLKNLEGLIAAGVEPYPARATRTHTIAAARALV